QRHDRDGVRDDHGAKPGPGVPLEADAAAPAGRVETPERLEHGRAAVRAEPTDPTPHRPAVGRSAVVMVACVAHLSPGTRRAPQRFRGWALTSHHRTAPGDGTV